MKEETTKPTITKTTHILPFSELSPEQFERLCLWLVEREGYIRVEHFGVAGSESGRDLIGVYPSNTAEQLWYFQCKRHQRINAKQLFAEVDKYNRLVQVDPTKKPYGIVFVTNANISAHVRERVREYSQKYGYDCAFWARTELDMLVKKHDDIMIEFFNLVSSLKRREDVYLREKPKVFISYAREDITWAQRLYVDLQDSGVDPWFDKESLRPGQQWQAAIKQAIRDCRYFIALLSSTSVGRKGFVHKELVEALGQLDTFPESDIFLIPARLDECQPSHEKLRDLHWVDMFPLWEDGLSKIMNSILKNKDQVISKSAELNSTVRVPTHVSNLDGAGIVKLKPSARSLVQGRDVQSNKPLPLEYKCHKCGAAVALDEHDQRAYHCPMCGAFDQWSD